MAPSVVASLARLLFRRVHIISINRSASLADGNHNAGFPIALRAFWLLVMWSFCAQYLRDD
jgi:hypothetical protein